MLRNVRFTAVILCNMNKQFVSIHIFQTAPQCTSFLQLLLNVIYSSDMEFSQSFVVCHQGSETDLQYVKCSTMYLAVEIIKQQSCPNKSPLLLDNPIQQSAIWNMFICIMQHYANYYFTATDGISKQGAQLLLGWLPHAGKSIFLGVTGQGDWISIQ